MILFNRNRDRWYQTVWWFCMITLPWIDMANNVGLILLVLLWIADGNFRLKWLRLKTSGWVGPFLFYYLLLVIGMVYTSDFDNGLFILDRKITFFILPVIAATGRELDAGFIAFLKRSFVYSCSVVILVCLALASYYFFHEGSGSNFDFYTNENFKTIHPDISPAWTHFSYIQLAHWAGLHPAYLSMYLLFCLVILFTENYKSKREMITHLILGCVIVCFLALLATRMAILSFIGIAVYFSFKKAQEKKFKLVLLVTSFSIFIALLLWLNPVARFRVLEEPMITTYQADKSVTNWNSVNYRLLEWEGSWSTIRKNWLFGVGTGDGKQAMDNFYSQYNSTTVGLIHNAHNQYLQTWMESGVIGLIVFLVCLFAGLFSLYKDSSYVSFILIFSFMCLTESIGERQKGVVFFMLFQALYLGSVKEK